ncbi:MAG: tetratricopeptide repeat protein [Planctomycetes bacterium]|nr:tetratricopeptide repeat protein [Planctomycetota bacterium]
MKRRARQSGRNRLRELKRGSGGGGASTPEEATSVPRRRVARLLAIVVLGAVLVILAAWFRNRVGSSPYLRIPPIETRDLLPAVAKEIRAMQDRIAAHPDLAAAWGEYGLVLLAHGFRKEAGDCFREAEKLDAADYRWPYYLGMTMGVWDAWEAWEAFQRAARKAPERLPVRLRLAEWSFDMRDLEQCERETDCALGQDPHNPRAQVLKARLLFHRGEVDESLQWALRAAASPRGDRRDVHELLARIYLRRGDREKAAQEVQAAQKLPGGVAVWDDPEMSNAAMYLRDASILNTRAGMAGARGDVQGHLNGLRQVVEAEPHYVLWKEHLAAALVEAKHYDEAAEFLARVLKEHPNSSFLVFQRGRVHFARNEMQEARNAFERAVAMKPDYDEALAWLGRTLLAGGDAQAAIAPLREATRLNPKCFEALDGLGRAYQTAGMAAEARSVWERAVQLAPENVDARLQLAELLLAGNRRQEALEQLRAAEKTDPQSARVKQLLDKCRTGNE